ncbi:MAG TPA: hypothetical protein VEI97_17410, partial [bacterium]|nr:hypothetical protein [bacterium]
MNHRCPPSLTLLPILAAVGLGCTGAPNPTTGSPQPAPRPAAGAGDLVTAAVGAFRLTIDPSAGTAAFTPVHGRTAQQSELYNLSIEHFMRPGTLTVTGVGLDADTLWVDYAATHPFPKAANLSGPPTATNREDLAVSGRILFLIDDGTEYFGGNVTANTALVTNADGYFQPGDLITDPGLAADTFPYKLLVDEAADNRVGLPNGGPTGNYTPAAGGWQVPEFTAGITGYDIWAQGQAATGRLELDRPTLEALGPVAIDTVIVVKYEDPRGGSTGSERRANRLPQNDPLKFAYRMPHGALDVGKVSYAGETGGLVANTDSATTVRFTVRDWDAFATPAGQTNLAGIADVSLVSQGEPGLPKVEVSIPAVLGDVLAELGHVDNGATGHAGSELLYEGAVPNLGTGQSPSGELATGLARAIDIVDRTPPPQWANVNRFNLSPDLIPFTPVTEGITYQRFAVAIAGSPTVFGCNFPLPPKTVPDFTTPFSVATRVTWNTYLNPPHPTWDQFTFKALDTGASLDPAHPGIILQGKALTVADKTDFYRFAPATPDSFTAERLTDWTATPQNQAFDVEVDAANRVFFLTL